MSSVDWFRSYLSGRTQIVNVNQVDFAPLDITCGVPQDSNLDPPFLCYVNDMPISVDRNLFLYADDCALLVPNKDPKIVADKLSYELESCRQWLIDIKLSVHLGKTEAILFGSKRKLNFVQDFSVICDGKKINNASSVKYLWVTLDNTLSGDSIALNVIKKASGRPKFLYKHSGCLNFKTRKTLCSALCVILTTPVVLGTRPHLRRTKTSCKLCRIKFFGLFLAWGRAPRTHIGQEELGMVGMISCQDRVLQLKLNYVFEIFS